MNTARKKLGSRLYTARMEAGYSQSDVQDSGIISQSHLSKIENGELMVNVFTLIRLSKLYGKNIEYFTNDLIQEI